MLPNRFRVQGKPLRTAKVGSGTIFFSIWVLAICVFLQQGCSDGLLLTEPSHSAALQQAVDAQSMHLKRVTDSVYGTNSKDSLKRPPVTPQEILGILGPVDSLIKGLGGIVSSLDSILIIPPSLKDSLIVKRRGGLDTALVLNPCGKDSANVGSSGRAISLSCLGNGAEFRVEKDVLTLATKITIQTARERSDDLIAVEFEFGPDGLRFDRSAVLAVPNSEFLSNYGQLPQDGYWLYFDPAKSEWELLGKIQVDSAGMFAVPVDHFSKYRLVVTPAIGLSQGGQD